jgi:hypothetical protein
MHRTHPAFHLTDGLKLWYRRHSPSTTEDDRCGRASILHRRQELGAPRLDRVRCRRSEDATCHLGAVFRRGGRYHFYRVALFVRPESFGGSFRQPYAGLVALVSRVGQLQDFEERQYHSVPQQGRFESPPHVSNRVSNHCLPRSTYSNRNSVLEFSWSVISSVMGTGQIPREPSSTVSASIS